MNYLSGSLHEYLLLLTLPEAVEEKIMQMKKEFNEKFAAKFALNRPHITLNTFTQYASSEPRIISKLKSVSQAFDKIKIDLNGYDSFPTHTIYINVDSRLPILELVKSIRMHTQQYMKPDKNLKPFFTTTPHLTISKGLTNQQYEEGWKWLQNHHFKSIFYASSMRLLKRPPGGKYKLVEQFVFEKTKIEMHQGLLF